MKYSYAIFDMDGLMFDTENLFVTSFETEVSRATGYRFERQQNAGAVSAAVSGLPRQL